MLYLCWITTLWKTVMVEAHGGCKCPNNHFVPGHQHLASWPNPRHKKSHTIIQYVTSPLNQNIVECSRGQFISPSCRIYASVNWVSIGSDNGLSHFQRQIIIWTNARLLSIRSLGTNFSKIWIKIHKFSFTKMQLNGSSARWRPFCPGRDELKHVAVSYTPLTESR